MKVVIMAGGTGGHIMPGLALAAGLQARGVHIDWLGTERGLESRLVPERGIALHTLHIGGVRGKGWMARLLMPLQLTRAVLEAWRALRRIQPQLVFGFGGYVAAPGGLAAWLNRTPLFIHEQNARAGSTNRLLRRFARRVFAAYPGALPNSTVVGNPVRENILAVPAPAERAIAAQQPLRVLVLGGSQGARVLNQTVPAALALMPAPLRPEVRHQAGKTLDEACQAYTAADIDVRPEAFIEDMPAAYAHADLVICRAGALSLAEIMAVGLPAICVPLPHAIDDHQTANARFMADAGAAWLVPESTLNAQSLASLLEKIAENPQQLAQRAEKARTISRRHANDDLVDACMQLLEVRR